MLYSFKSIYLQERLGNWDCFYIRKNKNFWMWWHDGSVFEFFFWLLESPFSFLQNTTCWYCSEACTFYHYGSKSCIWVTELCDFKMDVIKWWLNFLSCCNLGLKLFQWFQIKFLQSDHSILKWCVISDSIIYMKKLLGSDWLRQIQFSGNSVQKRVNSVQRK